MKAIILVVGWVEKRDPTINAHDVLLIAEIERKLKRILGE